jgi:fatty-acid desaturase
MSFQGEVIGWVAIHRRHHAFTDRSGDPHSPCRHGTGPRQVDISAAVIRVFERLGWATAVRWPDPVRLAARRRPSAQDRPRAALPPPGR